MVVDSCSSSAIIVCYSDKLITLDYTYAFPAPASRKALKASISV